MQNLGRINEYTIISIKHEVANRISYLAKNDETQTNYIIEFKKNNTPDFPANEINILNILNNANSPYLLHYIRNENGQLILNGKESRNESYIIFEDASKYDLYNYINKFGLGEKNAKLIFFKIITGIQAMHNLNICHRNINTSNILFDANYNPKICGFYYSCINANNFQDQIGSEGYMAPEILANRQYDGKKADIFSLGQLLFNLVTGLRGFESANNSDHYYRYIKQKNYEKYFNLLEPMLEKNLSDEFKHLYVRMIAYEPNERPTIDEILNDPWVQEINNFMQALENEVVTEMTQREKTINNEAYIA